MSLKCFDELFGIILFSIYESGKRANPKYIAVTSHYSCSLFDVLGLATIHDGAIFGRADLERVRGRRAG